ncbi:MAG: PQQ-binding-like beta-propeller repeat protein, partial [Ktedonobacteraceae bacterium]|nr:PQQ-binding-like beta-propeller repeat protein [Ktedonobacteraceae bacterium]
IQNTSPGSQPFKSGIQPLQEALRQGLAVATELWSFSTTDWVTSVHAADIDGDGDIEVVAGSRDGSVRVLTRGGQLKWQQREESLSWVGAVQCISNKDATDATRVVIGARNGKVIAFSERGEEIWRYQAGQAIRRIRVEDVDQDGKVEVLVASEDCLVHVLACETGEPIWTFQSNGWIRSVVSIDLDGDDEIETLAASGDQNLYVLDSGGQVKRIFATKSKIHSLYAIDLDRDGEVEILYGSNTKDLCAMKSDGRVLWQFDPQNRIHSINAADLNQDGELEVIAASEDEHLYFLDRHGQLIWKHYLGHRIFSVFTIDLTSDGIWEVLIGADDNNVHVLRVELSDGLLPRIRSCYQELDQPQSAISYLSPTEKFLLQDLIRSLSVEEYRITLTDVKQLLAARKYYEALAALLCLREQRVQILWAKDVGHLRTLGLHSINPQEQMDIFIGTDEGEVKMLDQEGNVRWSRQFAERANTIHIADMDQDGDPEVIAGCRDGHVHVLDSKGQSILWQARFDSWIESVWATHAQGSDSPEMIVCSTDHKINIYGSSFSQVVEPIETPQTNQIIRTYDLDGDGEQEIIAGAADDSLYVYRRHGEAIWSFPFKDRIKSFYIQDIDHDGHIEIIVASEDRNLYVLDYTGRNLKWRYYTPHRVLDVDAVDADGDGQVEIFAGVADGVLYVFNTNGDILWQFRANDRIRIVRVADVNGDGKMEILVGSEDRLYMLQLLDRQQLDTQIDLCWHALLEHQPFEEVMQTLVRHRDAFLRAFALRQLAVQPQRLKREMATALMLLADDAIEVKLAFASEITALEQASRSHIRQVLESLSTDTQRDVRLAFIDNLPALCIADPQLGFEYLDRFTRNVNRWIRRMVVRKLDQLVEYFPDQVFDLLLNTIQDQSDWIRQESARVLAHYFDVHSDDLLRGLRLLLCKELRPNLFQIMISSSTSARVKNIIGVFLNLLREVTKTTVVERMTSTIDALQVARTLETGELHYKLYHELTQLHRWRAIDQVAQYRCMLDSKQLEGLEEREELHFDEMLQVLHHLNDVTRVLRTYLRREGLGDRISSLLEASTNIQDLLEELEEKYYSWCKRPENFPDHRILKLLLENWRNIVAMELGQLRGKAELRPDLQTRQAYEDDTIGIVLSIQNVGRSPADHVLVILNPSDCFTAIAPTMLEFETIPTHEPIQAEFVVKPHSTMLQLAFTITYNDAEAREKVINYGDRLELVEHKNPFIRLRNPYYPGTPIQNQSMFYGREKELEELQEDFVYSTANTVVVLYGQRRSGKTSLLYKLLNTPILEPHIPVRVDMQHETLNFSIGRFLRNIAYYIMREMNKRGIQVELPMKSAFDEDATFTLDLFLDAVEAALQDRKLVILIDEFEVLEEQVV